MGTSLGHGTTTLHSRKDPRREARRKDKIAAAAGSAEPLTAHVLDLQRSAGNQAIAQLIDGTAAAPARAAVWEIPAETFGFAQATAGDRLTARKALAGMATKFEGLRRFLSPEDGARVNSALSGIEDEMRALDGSGPLTPREVGDLTVVGGLARMSFEQLTALAANNLKAAVAKFFEGHGLTDAELDGLREDLHFTFIESASEARIKEIGEAFETLKGYQEASGKVVSWAKKIMDFVEAPERLLHALEHVGEFSEKVEKLGNGVKEVIEIADDLGKLTGFDGQKVGETQNLISQARAGFDLLDLSLIHI